MDNHQEELAKEMERQGFLVWGKLGYVNSLSLSLSLYILEGVSFFLFPINYIVLCWLLT